MVARYSLIDSLLRSEVKHQKLNKSFEYSSNFIALPDANSELANLTGFCFIHFCARIAPRSHRISPSSSTFPSLVFPWKFHQYSLIFLKRTHPTPHLKVDLDLSAFYQPLYHSSELLFKSYVFTQPSIFINHCHREVE